MKTITVTMSDEVYRDVLDNVMVRRMVGEGHGVMDTAMTKIIQSIREGEDAVTLEYKNKEQDEQPSED